MQGGQYGVVFASCRSRASAEDLASSLRDELGTSTRIEPLVMDLIDEESIASAKNHVEEQLKVDEISLGLLFNVAGVLHGNIGG